ncbi:MAG TPA: TonB-dependent receptor [Terriglobales bacterium]|nr:TonB-dependent receptor [Terriglobales bacterium]
MPLSHRYTSVFLLLSIFLSRASAEIKLRVVDPQDAAVAGAEVQLIRLGKLVAVASTSAEGLVIFREPSSSSYSVHVLAPGFAVETLDLSPTATNEVVTIKLRLATASETVVVTATRTPVPSQAGGADVDSLSSQQLEVMQPIAADDAMRFLPGAVVNTAGQRGGISSLFVRGGESTYNKVIVDGVAIDIPGQTFDFGTLPLAQADRLEFVRGAQSTLYGSDAMTSVVQVWTRTGSTSIPELRFGADGGNFGTANGYASLAGAHRRFDYNFFGDQFNTNGQGVNDAYSDSLEGANIGVALNDKTSLRLHMRHSNSHTGVPGEWSFNGYEPPVVVNGVTQPLQPDPGEWSQLNSLLGSVELTVAAPSGWQHRFTGFDYLYRYTELNANGDPNRVDGFGYPFDFLSHEYDHINHVGFEYQGDYSERTWAHSTFGYRIENENGVVGDLDYPPSTSGQRLNQDAYLQQQLTLGRLSVIAGGRFVHSSVFGNTSVPRVALTLLALRGGELFSGTRLRFSYATGFMEPALYQTFAGAPYYVPNPGLLPERTRAFEAGVQQSLLAGRWSLDATYFNNLFHDQIEYATNQAGLGQFFNLQQSLAHGAEFELQGRIWKRLSLNTAYTYTSTQILQAPLCTPANFCDPVFASGSPLLRRPKHSATTLLSYLAARWGASLGGSFVGRRPDSDFENFNINHAAGYARVDLGGWYAINSHITAYANVENALNAHYNEVVGYPALMANFRAGLRFRIGGE